MKNVKSNAVNSEVIYTQTGLSQGGLTVVLLFIFYIKDMTQRIPKHVKYADDQYAWYAHRLLVNVIKSAKIFCKNSDFF